MVRLVTLNDIPAWLELAKEVEPLFGEMVGNPDLEHGIRHAIFEKSVYGIENDHHSLEGIIALDRSENAIAWLAVSSKAQGKGIGSKLVEKALDELDRTQDITVQTFAESQEEGTPARKLYMKYGFQRVRPAEKNPAGIETIIMEKSATTHE